MPPPGALLTLSRSMCYGSCPVYDLVVFRDGWVEYDGRDFVRVLGRQRYRISRAQVDALAVAIERSHFDGFRPAYPCGWTDNPTTVLCVAGTPSARCVSYEPRHVRTLADGGVLETGAPIALSDLVRRIEETAGVLLWSQTDEQVERALRHALSQHFEADEAAAPCPIHACFRPSSPGSGCSVGDAAASARIAFDLTVDSHGQLASFSMHATHGSLPPETARCLSDVVRAWVFPARAWGDESTDATVVWSPRAGVLDVETKTRQRAPIQ
jgi:hypothetical protein